MSLFGEHIRQLREKAGQPLRTVAAYLDIDQAILSKMERGHKKANRKQVMQLAAYFNGNEAEFLKKWLTDKVLYELQDEELALEALKVAEKQLKYKKTKK